jgi:hypothetical protein
MRVAESQGALERVQRGFAGPAGPFSRPSRNVSSPCDGFPMRPLALLLLVLAGCGPPGERPGLDLKASAPRTYYVETARGRTMFFETALTNTTDSARAFYLFAYAFDNTASPPARAVYPPRALSGMPPDLRFAVVDPRIGLRVDLAPGDSGAFRGALPMPTETTDGRPIAATAFRDFQLFVFDLRGRNVFRAHWPLVRVRGEETR